METGWGPDSRTAPDWLQCPNRQPWPRVGWWSPVDVVFYGPFEQAAGGGFEAAENSFLELVGHRLKQTSLTDVDRRLSAVEELPARIVVGADEQAPATRTHVRLAIDNLSARVVEIRPAYISKASSAEKRFGVLPDEQRRKIVHDTAARVYGLD
jgi:predicted TIM-barrel fold metal-dependent hydrolase